MSHDAKQKQFMTIAGRWRQHVAASGLDKSLSRRDQSLAMLMFYAGFSASLEAALELADLDIDDDTGAKLLEALRREADHVAAAAAAMAMQTPAPSGGH